ncbi:MAG: hypothetical protein KBC35_03805 [Candidatus Pacebacteria bacterium]|nr:hypothetical protein [Candidatus Paceibacterota bacterium]
MKTIVFVLMVLFSSAALAAEPTTEHRGSWGEILKGEVIVLPSIKVTPHVNIELKSSNPSRGSIKILNGQVTVQTPEIKKEF